MKEIKLSKMQAEDIAYKLNIVWNEPELLEDYGLTEEEVCALEDSVPHKGGVWNFDDKYLPLVREEAQNLADLAYDPWAESAAIQPGDYKSAANLERKLEAL